MSKDSGVRRVYFDLDISNSEKPEPQIIEAVRFSMQETVKAGLGLIYTPHLATKISDFIEDSKRTAREIEDYKRLGTCR